MENKNGGKKKHGGPMSGMAPVEKAKDFKYHSSKFHCSA